MSKPVTEGERRFQKALDTLGVKYRMGIKVGPYEVDFLIDDTIIEVDGYTHLLPERIDSDAKKELYLAEKGYRLIRVESEQTRDLDFIKKLIKTLDKPLHINDNEPITHRPFSKLEALKDELFKKEQKKKKSGREEMLEWLKNHSEKIPASKDGEDDGWK